MFDSFLLAHRILAAYLSLTIIQEESTSYNIQLRNLHIDVPELQLDLFCPRYGIQLSPSSLQQTDTL
jgi:hypothetical protein